MIEASHTDFNEAYAAIDRHQLDDFAPHIYRTRDQGRTWQEITRGLPPNGYVHTVKEDPVRRGLLFAGTERSVYVSFDSGDSWQPFQLNLPTTSMRDIEVHDTDLVVATHGRGFWVIDDMSVLREVNPSMTAAPAVLFKPADAIAVVQGGDNGTPWQKDEPQAENAPSGATIDYYLKTPSSPAKIEILDASERVVRAISSDDPPPAAVQPQNVSVLWQPRPNVLSGDAGHHRWVWDLRPTPVAGAGRGGRATQPMQTGKFTVRLTANGQTYTQPLIVKPDPRTR
jgi:hypothetical protein